MEKKTEKLQPKYLFTGPGIALGISAGMIGGLLFSDGDVALGIGIGFSFGLILGSIIDILRDKIIYALACMVFGAAAGSIGGLILGLLHGAYEATIQHGPAGPIFGLSFKNGYIILGAVIVGAIGLTVGIIVGARKLHLENQITPKRDAVNLTK